MVTKDMRMVLKYLLSHLRGSNSIGQLSDCVIALERNQQSDDPDEARTTRDAYT